MEEIEELRRQLRMADVQVRRYARAAELALDSNIALIDENTALREALEPFAEFQPKYYGMTLELRDGTMGMITVPMINAARQALGEENVGQERVQS
jgi:hypothetical protein